MAKVVLRSIFLSFVFLLATILAERPGYFITAPNVFHIGVEETVSVSVYNVSQRLKIKLYLQDYPNRQKIFSSAESTFANADKLKIVKLKVNPEDLPASEPGDKQHVYLVAHSLSPNLPFIKYTKILVSPRNAVVFIQTDKPIYTLIQTVKIRVIPLEFDLRSSSTKINLVIKNPQQVNVQQWKDLNTDTGFISKNLPLQGSAMIGNWTISAFYGHQMSQNTTVKFEVREYVLPTYSVKISGPDYILLRDKTVGINIASSYTYGKPVEGEVHVKLSVVGLGKEPVLVFSQYGPLKSGKKTFQFLNNVVKNHRLIQNFPSGRRLQVEADVVEKATGRKESAIDNSIYFVESPFIVNCDQTPKYFKPGLPFEVKVRVLYPNRNPASGIELHLTASGTDSKGGQVKVLGKINGRTVLRLDDRTDGKGVVYFVIDIPRNAKSVKMKVKTKEPGLPNANKELVVKPYQSPSGSYILIRENREREKLGQYEVLSNKNISRLTYMVVARGKIVTQRSMRRAFGVITTIKIPMTPELSPSARIIVHCTVNGNEVVADSLLIDPEDKLSNEIQLLPDDRSSNTNGNNNNKEFPPGSNYRIRIKGKPNTRVALLGLDKSVYLLRNKHKLTKKKVFKTLGSLDLGCGVGPEETNKEVFEKAGLAVISNKNLVTAPREEFGCKESSSKRRKRSLISDLKVCCGEGKFILGRSTCERKLKFKFNRGLHTEACLRMFYNCCLAEWGDADEPPFDDVVFIRGRNFKKEFEEFVPEQSEEELIESRQDRTDFPETWIYEEDVIGTSGELSLDVTLPQTITSWSIQAMAVSNTSGFGMAAPLSVRTYQPFFVSVSLPYSVQRGEQFVVVATVFSYVPRELGIDEGEVKIHIEGSDDFCSSVRPGQRSKPVTLTLKHQDSQTAMFPIVPIRLGKIPIKVTAVSTKFGSADIVEKMLLVVPEGVERTITHSLAIDPQGVLRDVDKPNKTAPTKPFTSGRIIGDGRQMDHVLLTIPKRAIPGSMSAMLSITGNLIGPVVTNLITGGFDELLRMPTGCGEQTMIYMAPNVYVLQYLTNTKQVTASVESRAYRYIQSGEGWGQICYLGGTSQNLIYLKKNVRPTVDRFEISDRHVVLYVSEVYSHKEFCTIFKVNRKHKVGTIQPVPVKVYDYYEPDEACTKFYGPDKYSALVLGICEGEQCRCTQDACSACDPIVKKTTDLLTKACTEYDYAFRATVGLVDERDKGKESWLVYTMTIQEVIKPGEFNFVVGELVDFMKRAGCRCPDMKMKKDYLVMGMNKRQQFLLDDKTFVKRWPRKGKEKDVFIDFRARMSSQNRCG